MDESDFLSDISVDSEAPLYKETETIEVGECTIADMIPLWEYFTKSNLLPEGVIYRDKREKDPIYKTIYDPGWYYHVPGSPDILISTLAKMDHEELKKVQTYHNMYLISSGTFGTLSICADMQGPDDLNPMWGAELPHGITDGDFKTRVCVIAPDLYSMTVAALQHFHRVCLNRLKGKYAAS